MGKDTSAHASDETFDEFLADQGILEPCEEDALEEIVADQDRMLS